MRHKIDIEQWERKSHFQFFMKYEDPTFGITANVDVSHCKEWCIRNSYSFFLASLYCSNLAVNAVENFRLRIQGEEVIVYDEVSLGSTIFTEKKLFSFAYFNMEKDIHSFCKKSLKLLEKYHKEEDFDPKGDQLDIIYYSVIPWLSFTSIKHPTNNDASFSIPKITFGKYFEQGNRLWMPVSVEANHALMDGYHIGQYFKQFQRVLDSLK